MRMKNIILSAVLIAAAVATPTMAPAAGTPFSKYGQIQNVQNYSSNPFWNPNGPYNQRMPQPIYVQGADLNTGDCQRTVSALVASECATRNRCVGVTLSDIRPSIMLQLSRLPGHNFATACAGFIDEAFNDYVQNYSNAAPTGNATAFPTATTTNPSLNESEFKIKNPYTPKAPTWNGESWFLEMKGREEELKQLQSQNGAGTEKLVRADFPTTYSDLSFTERMENEKAGFEPYKDAKAYVPLGNIESYEDYLARRERTHNSYCASQRERLAMLTADLATLKKCRAAGTSLENCKLQGTY